MYAQRPPVLGASLFHVPPDLRRCKTQIHPRLFLWLLISLISLGIVRSTIATRLDGFTIDEAYHIAAAVSYVRFGDFRINPEHPPLVKLWVGSVISVTGFKMAPLRQFSDKPDERVFTETLVFQTNDADSVQRRARTAMYMLNGLLLGCLAFALRRAFNSSVALATSLFLVIDPTVAAHWPVVMTDLPVALLSASAIVWATSAFRDWAWRDVALCSLFLGLTLITKHSAPVVLLIVAVTGVCLAILRPTRQSSDRRGRKLLKVVAVVAGALVVLWGSYLFRYAETPSGQESFNRPLVDKINDVVTPMYHTVLATMAATHVVPRAYIWGFADTVHAGMEGRVIPQLIFGHLYIQKGPKYFFPAMIALKLPIGLTILVVLGLFLFVARRLVSEWNLAVGIVFVAAISFLLVLGAGATYAGIRHALPVVVLLSIFAGLFVEHAFASGAASLKAVVALAYLAAIISAVPVMRPWEYFNELVGGKGSAYKYFSDEGVDLGQRTREAANYYYQVLRPAGEVPYVLCYACTKELKGRGVDYVGLNPDADFDRMSNPEQRGTILTSVQFLMRTPYFDLPGLRVITPTQRFGNLFVYRGTFHLPGLAAGEVYFYGIEKLYAEKPDMIAAEKAFQRSVELDPSIFFVHIELANLLLKRGASERALGEYSQALLYAPTDPKIRKPIEMQISLFRRVPAGEIPILRNPGLE
jgi:tetratricopeptide (TPR) repeat protein